MRKMILLLVLIGSLLVGHCWAQEKGSMLKNSGQDILMVTGCGVAGGILGLSTLSFVEKPGDHLNNIVVGGAIGLIVGVAAVAWFQATKSQSGYVDQAAVGPKFNTDYRYSWHKGEHSRVLSRTGFRPTDVSYSFRF